MGQAAELSMGVAPMKHSANLFFHTTYSALDSCLVSFIELED